MKPGNTQAFNVLSLNNVIEPLSNYTNYNSTALASFNISFYIDRSVLSKYELFVYFILPNGDIASVDKEIQIQPCFLNKVRNDFLFFFFFIKHYFT